MSKTQEAFELEFGLRDNGEKYWQESSAFFKSWCDFQAGYQAAIEAMKAGGATAWAFEPDEGEIKVHFGNGPINNNWIELYKLPEDE